MLQFKQYITEMIHGKTEKTSFGKLSNDLKKTGRNIDHITLSNHYTPRIKSENHLNSVYNYTSVYNNYASINNFLNDPKKTDSGDIRSIKKTISHLDEVTTFHKAPHDFHVYSGIKFDPSKGKNHKEPFKAHIKQFTSATISPNVASTFAGTDTAPHNNIHMLKIHIPKGSKHGAYIHDHSEVTRTGYGNEYEFLMKRNLKLKIHHEPEIKSGKDNVGNKLNYKIWHATIED